MVMVKRPLTRRKFIGYSAALGVGALLAACGGNAPPESPGTASATQASGPSTGATAPASATQASGSSAGATAPAPTQAAGAVQSRAAGVQYAQVVTTVPGKFNESPVLAKQVQDGKLPPLKDRLPEEPLVIKPIEIGQYGGSMRVGNFRAAISGGDQAYGAGNNQNFYRFNPDLTSAVPNVAKAITVSDDKRTYTINLRRGMKWSDGAPYTAKDVLFWYEDILLNKEISPSVGLDFRPGGKVMELTTPDDYTVVITFAVPHPRFLMANLTHRYGWYLGQQAQPAHYLKPFHIKYNPQANDEAKAEKFNTWVERFSDRANLEVNPAKPLISAFVVDEVSPTVVRYRRNPYFWMVDSEGNQLPYIDTMEMERLQNVETYHAKIVTGAFDYAVFDTDILNFSTYEGSASKGNYKLLLWSSGRGGEVFFQVNMNFADEVLRKIHQDVRYRRALSIAINREEINRLLFFGQAVPRQMTVIPESKYYKPEYEQSWAQYDVDQANKLLDEMGLKWDAAKKVRLRSDGKPMQVNFSYYDGEGPKTAILELVAEFWRVIGIDVAAKSITRQLLAPRVRANEEPMSLWHGDASTDVLLPVDRKWSIGKDGDECTIAPLWNQWFQTGGSQGEEPPEWYKTPLNAWKTLSETLDPAAAAQLLQSQADNVWSIGTVGMAPWPFIAKNSLRNVPKYGITTWDGLFLYPYHPETFFQKP